MNSVLATIRAAMQPGAANLSLEIDETEGNQPGASASGNATPPPGAQPGAKAMADEQEKPGGASATGADTTSLTEAEAKGYAAANERMSAVLGATGIKGDGKRMAAALDLAVGSPAMAADAVTAFVTANVAAAETKPAATGESYEQQRLSANGLATPNGGEPPKSASILANYRAVTGNGKSA
ncbi:putative lytic murein transglycosylase [Rhizobium phage vB_RleM_PPF1]|uniref:putative lytic murein transglycosylase n=1 Tax=Rhizobium phage vB_RleM_PPF1 TaxID=1498228 RepID=UPI00049A0374|nr:putative lytic murein transglycosylase [Rhizobium phage vB_RleM_PPF1]AID18319.1 putative lytic murein transglycosylase [Rhizobium phage vB_RleM_PPF1]